MKNANEQHAEATYNTLVIHAQKIGKGSLAKDMDDTLRMAKERFIVQQKYPLANIIEGDGTNAPDIAVLTGSEIDSGLLSGFCYTAEDAWADAARRIADEAVPAMSA